MMKEPWELGTDPVECVERWVCSVLEGRRLRRAGKCGLEGEQSAERRVCVLCREESRTTQELKDEAEPKDTWLIF